MDGTTSDEVVDVGAPLQKLLLRPEEAAALLSVGRSRIYELMAAAKLKSVRIGGSRRIPVAALDAFVKQLQEEDEASRWWQR
ncbi:MAG TPA: excisionase family DNA-binding protein [Acidimicrobiales bacterium]|nr:excisionase family DNA-binding protein [Acidimicrobiales bacterium]